MEQPELTLAAGDSGRPAAAAGWPNSARALSRSQLQNLIEAGSVTCNGAP